MTNTKIVKEGDLAIQVLQRIGSPAGEAPIRGDSELNTLREEYELAFENRIGLLYLLARPEEALPSEFSEKRKQLLEREAKTEEVVIRLCAALNELGTPYVIFKTVRPFPFTPNDTDVLFLGSRKQYKTAVQYLLEKGYQSHGKAPL